MCFLRSLLLRQVKATEVVESLLDQGADVDNKNNHGDTPLHRAAANGHLAVVEIIIKKGKGADANVSDRSDACQKERE